MTRSLIDIFIAAIHAERSASVNTCRAYRRDLDAFEGFVERAGRSLLTATRDDIEQFMIARHTQGVAASSRARMLSTLRQFYRFALAETWRTDLPTADIRSPGRHSKLPDTLTSDEVERLITVAHRHGANAMQRTRNGCMVELLYATGMRVGELVGLTVLDLQHEHAILRIHGKGGKERLVPLTAPARASLAAWLACRAACPAMEHAHHIFPGRSGGSHISRISAYRTIKAIAVEAGLDANRVSPHAFRHAIATHLLANGANLRSIQTVLGHADISTTEIYANIVDERLKSLVFDMHPLATERAD